MPDHHGKAEIGNPQVTLTIEQQIGWLDIPMDDSVLVGEVEGFGYLRHEFHDSADVSGALDGSVDRF
jgi:hypothetical protein